MGFFHPDAENASAVGWQQQFTMVAFVPCFKPNLVFVRATFQNKRIHLWLVNISGLVYLVILAMCHQDAPLREDKAELVPS